MMHFEGDIAYHKNEGNAIYRGVQATVISCSFKQLTFSFLMKQSNVSCFVPKNPTSPHSDNFKI